jgi:5-(carboxyamino)imidazole ribonucleotide synthase
MLGEEARRKGLPLDLVAVDPTPDCPANPVLARQIVADVKDAAAIRELAASCDLLTFEIEQANSEVLAELEASGRPVHPSPATLRIIQDKLSQKTFLRSKGLPVADFREVSDKASLEAALAEFGYPAVLKARRDSYDGRGNAKLEGAAEVEAALARFAGRPLMLERFVPFEMEISVIAARSTAGEIRTFPVGENIHLDNILRTTIVPARIPAEAARKAEALAAETLRALAGAGVFGIEMFLAPGGSVLVNEIAPRVHNSGHYTIEACRTSQFEQHLRAISGMPLGDPSLLYASVMVNLLGADGLQGPYRWTGVESIREIPGAHVHLYGKRETAPRRKLGHVTLTGVNHPSFQETLMHRAQFVVRMIGQKA